MMWLIKMEANGVEPITSALQRRRSPNWAKPPVCNDLSLKNSNLSYKFNFLNLNQNIYWAYLDLNQGPQLYQSCALANWAIRPRIFNILDTKALVSIGVGKH